MIRLIEKPKLTVRSFYPQYPSMNAGSWFIDARVATPWELWEEFE